MILNYRLKLLRKRKKYTQAFVASKLGIAYQSYQNYERGLTLPTLENFVKLADLYEVSLDYLIGRKEYLKWSILFFSERVRGCREMSIKRLNRVKII